MLFLITLAIGLLKTVEFFILVAGVGVLYTYGTRNYRKAALLAFASLGIYAAEGYLLQAVLPLEPAFDWNWPSNIHPLSSYGFESFSTPHLPCCYRFHALLWDFGLVIGCSRLPDRWFFWD